ncbi:MAG: hypothetical protein OHK0012_04010 [Synechococcales cyanobacterium]
MNYTDLTDQERELYLQALVSVARADEGLDAEEIAFLTDIAMGMGIPEAVIPTFLDKELLLSEIPPLHNAVGALLLRDMSAMAVINNELHEQEEAQILSIGEAMGFSSPEIEEFLNWAFMGLQWQLTSASLLRKYPTL